MRVVWLRGRCWWVAGLAGSAGCPEPLSNGQDQMCGIEGHPLDQRVFGTPSGFNVPKRPSPAAPLRVTERTWAHVHSGTRTDYQRWPSFRAVKPRRLESWFVTPTALDAGELDLVLGPVHADLPLSLI